MKNKWLNLKLINGLLTEAVNSHPPSRVMLVSKAIVYGTSCISRVGSENWNICVTSLMNAPVIVLVVIFRKIFVSYLQRMWLRPNNKVRGNQQLTVTSFEKLMTSLSRPFPVFSHFRFSSHFSSLLQVGFYSLESRKCSFLCFFTF